MPKLPAARLLLRLTALITLGFSANLQSQTAVPVRSLGTPETARIVAEFEDYLEHGLAPIAPGLAMAIVDRSGPTWINTWGRRELGDRAPIDPHTTFRLASLSKAFASATAGIMVQEGSLDWDSKLSALLPGVVLKDPARQQLISVRHILSNSTGLMPHAYTNLVEDNVPYERIVERLGAVDFVCEPGSCYTYQNVVYSVIGDILEKVSGMDYPLLVDEKLFTPLQMTDASVTLEDFIGNANHARPHERRRRVLRRAEVEANYYRVAPAAGVNASISDMAQWLEALLGERPDILPPEVLRELYTSHARVNDRGYYRGSWRNVVYSGYGLGWRVFDYAGTQVIFHGGWVRGYHAEIVLIPSRGLGMALLMNSDFTDGITVTPRFLDIALGLEDGPSILSASTE